MPSGGRTKTKPEAVIGSNVELGGLSRWSARRRIVGTSAVQLDSTKLTGRNAISVKMGSTAGNVYVGPSSAVAAGSTAAVWQLRAAEPLDLGLSTRAAIWAISTSTGRIVNVAQIG